MENYRGWVLRNRQWLASIESIANTMTWFLPERFSSSELAPEAVSTLLGLLTITNEHIVKTSARRPPSGRHVHDHQLTWPTPRQHNSFSWSFFVSVMKEVEVFVEMAAEHYGGKETKWNAVATVEGVKVLMRLMILHRSGYRILLDGGETENIGEASELPEPPGAPSSQARLNPMREYMGLTGGGCLAANSGRNDMQLMGGEFFPRNIEGRAMQAMSNFSKNMTGNRRPSWTQTKDSEISPHAKDAVLKKERTSAPSGLLGKLFVTGEVLLIARPLLYVFLIKRYGLKSWKPWLSSLAIDITGMSLLHSLNFLLHRRSENPLSRNWSAYVPFTDLEQNEVRRRQLAWAFYVMRDPFFSTYTRRPLEKVESALKPAPLIGTLAGRRAHFWSAIILHVYSSFLMKYTGLVKGHFLDILLRRWMVATLVALYTHTTRNDLNLTTVQFYKPGDNPRFMHASNNLLG